MEQEMERAARYSVTSSGAIFYQVLSLLRRLGLVNPRRLMPMIVRDLPEMDGSRREGRYATWVRGTMSGHMINRKRKGVGTHFLKSSEKG